MTSAILLPFGVINESRAECKYNYQSDAFYDENGKHCGTCGTGCSWKIEDGTLKITGEGEDVRMKSDASGREYFDSGSTNADLGTFLISTPWSRYYNEFSAIDIKGIESIAGQAFKGLKNVTQVTFDDTLQEIGYSSFENTGLTSVTLPKNVETSERAFRDSGLTEIILPDDITEEELKKIYIMEGLSNVTTIKCQGTSGDTTNCQNIISKAISRPVGSCYSQSNGNYFQKASYYCWNTNPEFISIPECPANCYSCDSEGKCTTCLHGKLNKEGSCIEQSACNSDEGYLIDTASASCRMLPGCGTFENGACTTCTEGYLTNSSGTCTPAADCKNGLHATLDGACEENPAGCNTFEDDRCLECNSGLFRQGESCVSSCGANYKLSDGICYRIRYTPAEAAEVVGETNTIFLYYK